MMTPVVDHSRVAPRAIIYPREYCDFACIIGGGSCLVWRGEFMESSEYEFASEMTGTLGCNYIREWVPGAPAFPAWSHIESQKARNGVW